MCDLGGDVLLLGTRWSNVAPVGPGSVWKSTDNGENWSEQATVGNNRAILDFATIQVGAITRLLAAVYSTAADVGYCAIWKSDDNGNTWSEWKVLRTSSTLEGCSFVEVIHVADGVIIAGTGNHFATARIFRYPATDSGDSVYVGEKCKTDFGDIRFHDGVNELDCWLQEKVDGEYAIFWVEVDSIPASPDSVTIFIYYGKADAITTSDGDATFPFFDHFPGVTIDGSKWTVRQGAVGISDSELIPTGTTGTRGLIDGLISFSYPKAVHFRMKVDQARVQAHHWALRKSNDWNEMGGDVRGYNVNNIIRFMVRKGGVSIDSGDLDVTTWISYSIYEIIWELNKSGLYRNEALLQTHTTNVATADQVVTFYEGNLDGDVSKVDWVLVRNYCSPEPTHGAWGPEETIVQDARSRRPRFAPQNPGRWLIG